MPDFRYVAFDARLASRKRLLRQLQAIFRDLLLRTSGDVEEALRILDLLGRRHGLLGAHLSIDDFRRLLEESREVSRSPRGGLVLTPRGERALRSESFELLFASLRKDGQGEHRVPHAGEGVERLPETRPYAFGDPTALIDGPGTLLNAIRRGGVDDLGVEEADLVVHETEHLSSCATVMLVDVSHSMVLYGEDRMTPAKRVALSLAELITTRYPKDALRVVLFGDEAREVGLEELPYISAGPYHTNTRDGLRMARDILRKQRQGNRQILLVTDGKPSAITEADGRVFKNPFGLDERIVNSTLDEAAYCRRLGIPITTFMLTEDPVLVEFVEQLSQVNRGRAYFSSPTRLGAFVLVDYIRNRRRRA